MPPESAYADHMTKAKTQLPDIQAARSWRGRWLRDAYENNYGLVSSVNETKEGQVSLQVRFLGEGGKERTVAMQPREDGEFLCPNEVKARYRPADEQAVRDHLRALK